MIEGTKTYKGKSPAPLVVREEQSPKDVSATDSTPEQFASLDKTDSTYRSPLSQENPNDGTAPTFPSSTSPSPLSNAVNLDRRKWLSSLVPAFGEGLVKILRESNHLKSELHEALKEKSREITQSAQSQPTQDAENPTHE